MPRGKIQQDLTIQLKFETGQWKEQTTEASKDLDQLNQRFKATANSTEKATKKANDFGKAMKYLIGLSVVQYIKNTSLELDRVSNRMKFATETANDFAEAMSFSADVANDLGLALVPTQRGLATLQASAKGTVLAGKEIEELFKGISQASGALSLTADETNSVFLAFSQIISKGKVQAEELRSQIGERIPSAMKIAERAMGVTGAELDKLLQSGSLMAEDLLPKLSKEFQKTFSGDAEKNANSLTATTNRLANEMKILAKYVSELTLEDSGLLDDMNEVLKLLKEFREGEADTSDVFDFFSGSPKIFDDLAESLAIPKIGEQTKDLDEDLLGLKNTLDSIAGSSADYNIPTFSELLGLPDSKEIEDESKTLDDALKKAQDIRNKYLASEKKRLDEIKQVQEARNELEKQATVEEAQRKAIDNYKAREEFEKNLLVWAEERGKEEKKQSEQRVKELRTEQKAIKDKIRLLKQAQTVDDANQVNFLQSITAGSNKDIRLSIEARTRGLGATAGDVDVAQRNAEELEEQTRLLKNIDEKLDVERA